MYYFVTVNICVMSGRIIRYEHPKTCIFACNLRFYSLSTIAKKGYCIDNQSINKSPSDSHIFDQV